MLTKPLQRKAFREMRTKLMNCKVNYEEEEVAFKESMAQAKEERAKQGNVDKKTDPVPGRIPSKVPPSHCRSVLEDLELAGDHKQWTGDWLEWPEFKQDVQTSRKVGICPDANAIWQWWSVWTEQERGKEKGELINS